MKVYRVLAAIFAVLALCSALYIFFNGTQNSVKSNERSDNVAEVVKPVVDSNNRIEEDKFSVYVRKYAHAIEYFAFGVFSGLAVIFLYLSDEKALFLLPVCLVSLFAVADEYIQGFVGRTSSVKDIVIDIAGGAVGYIAALAVLLIIKIANQKAKKG